MPSITENWTSQFRKAQLAFGQQQEAIDIRQSGGQSSRLYPYTPVAFARALSLYYHSTIADLAFALQWGDCPEFRDEWDNSTKADHIFDSLNIKGYAVCGASPLREYGKRLELTIGGSFFESITGNVTRETFPVTVLEKISHDIPESDDQIRWARPFFGAMARESARALLAIEKATVVKNENGLDCLDPISCVQFWDGWMEYANNSDPLMDDITVPSFWDAIAQSTTELPETVGDAAAAATDLAVDAAVAVAEGTGRVGGAFLSGLGVDTMVVLGAGWLGWKAGVFG